MDPARRYDQRPQSMSSLNLPRPNLPHDAASGTSLLIQPSGSYEKRKPKQSYFRTFCVTFRLHLLWDLCSKTLGWDNDELEKVAFYRSRRQVLIRSLLHLIPVAAAITLIYFNIWQYYIGGELAGWNGQDAQKLGGLQFAGKLHELFMLASLGAIVFAYIRAQLTFGDGVTIGTVLAGHQFTSISNLWSMEFWSTIYNANAQKRGARKQKWWLVTVITVATILGVSVGPSSNVLLRPRLEWWAAGGTDFWLNATQEAIFPRNYSTDGIPESCSQYSHDFACPYGDFDSLIAQRISFWPKMTWMGSLPEANYLRGQMSLREMRGVYRSPRENAGALIWGRQETSVFLPKAGISDVLTELSRLWAYAAANGDRGKRFRYRKDASHEVESFMPHVDALCSLQNETGATSDTQFTLTFANITNGTRGGTVPYDTFLSADASNETNVWLQNALFNTTADTGSILWYDDPGWLQDTNSSLLVITAFPAGVLTLDGGPYIMFCNIRSYHSPATYKATRNDPKIISVAGRNGATQPIFPSAAFAALTNPYLEDIQLDVFQKMTIAAGLSRVEPRISTDYVEYATETIIASMIINGLSLVPYKTGFAGDLKGQIDPENQWSGGAWVDEFLPGNELGYGGQAFSIPAGQESSSTRFTMRARVNGYAYSRRGIPQKVAIAVLLVYCLAALGHVFYNLFFNPISSSTWDTVSELTAVSLNSDRSAYMENTGAGIYSKHTLKGHVQVRVKDQDRLEIVFPDTMGGGEIVRPGKAYR